MPSTSRPISPTHDSGVGSDVDGIAYIRGGGGAVIDPHRLARIVLGACSAAVVVLVVLLTRSAVYQELHASQLRTHGVAMGVTVTGCVGLASGTGITTSGYTCWAAFALGGRRYHEVLHGSTARQPVGRTVRAVVLRNHPTTLTAQAAVNARQPSWRPFVAPVVLLVVWLTVVVGWLSRSAHRRRRRVTPEARPAQPQSDDEVPIDAISREGRRDPAPGCCAARTVASTAAGTDLLAGSADPIGGNVHRHGGPERRPEARQVPVGDGWRAGARLRSVDRM